MTTAAKDISNYASQPVILYEFYRKSTPTLTGVEVTSYWRYTSADRDFTYDGHLYTATAISDDGVRQSGDSTADQMAITVPYNNAIAQMFTGSPPSDPIYGIIRHGNVGETDAYIAWAGQISGVNRASSGNSVNGDVSAQLICTTVGGSMDRTGLRLAWARLCPHDLYGFECRADPTHFYVTGTLTAVTGRTVSATAFNTVNTPQLSGGFIEWIDADGHAERRGIIEHAGPVLTILGTAIDKLHVGSTVYAFFGCDHTRTMCSLVFDNEANHGGHAYMPDANPFDGSSVF